MDLFRPRAIPALIFALAAALAQAACDNLDGTYRYRGSPSVDGRTPYLSDLTLGPERRKLMRSAAPAKKQGLASEEPRSHQKVTHLAETARLTTVARGATFEFHDANGQVLATIGIGEGWSCHDGRLERSEERTAGLGENIRTDRVEQRLSKSGGDLVYTETVTTIEPSRGKPQHTEIRYAAVR